MCAELVCIVAVQLGKQLEQLISNLQTASVLHGALLLTGGACAIQTCSSSKLHVARFGGAWPSDIG